jgi:hypothetical protein
MPHIHEHINMLGRYSFVVPELVVLGELRPLPTPRTMSLNEVTTRKCQNCQACQNVNGTILAGESRFAPP